MNTKVHKFSQNQRGFQANREYFNQSLIFCEVQTLNDVLAVHRRFPNWVKRTVNHITYILASQSCGKDGVPDYYFRK